MFRSVRFAWAAGLVALVGIGAACGGSVDVSDAAGSGGESVDGGGTGGGNTTGTTTGTGSTGSTTTGTSSTTTSSTVTATTTTTTTTTGSACGQQAYDGFALVVDMPGGAAWGCGLGFETEQGQTSFAGAVMDADEAGNLVIDTCPPNADCMPMPAKISMSSPGMVLSIPIGTFVEVTVSVDFPWGCSHAILIRNLPEWGGEKNPAFGGQRLWVAGSDGSTITLPGSPVGIQAVPLGCYPDEPEGCGPKDDYLLRFLDQAKPESSIDLPMGQTGSLWVFSPEAQPLVMRNLRSYETGWCDDYWNWAYWITWSPEVDE